MNDNINKIKKANLKSEVIREYLYIFILIVGNMFSPYLLEFLIGEENTGIDGIGQALGIVIMIRIITIFITIFVCTILPIRLIIKYKNEYKTLYPKIKKVWYVFLTYIPLLFTLLVVFQVPISNFFYDLKYHTGKDSYKAKIEDYKSPVDFYNELKDRNLLYNNDTSIVMKQLNGEHDCRNYKNGKSQRCYEKSTMFGIESERYYDDIDDDDLIENNKRKYPVYIYNAILTLPSKNANLKYAALGRFSYSNDYGTYNSKIQDYYIECKILYVDEEIYAIIGLGNAYSITKYFDKYDNHNSLGNNYPFNIILSETGNVKAFYDGKYFPYGAIENGNNSFEFRANTENDSIYFSNYPVRKVDRLDLNTINNIAKEFEEGILKKSIDYYFSEKES